MDTRENQPEPFFMLRLYPTLDTFKEILLQALMLEIPDHAPNVTYNVTGCNMHRHMPTFCRPKLVLDGTGSYAPG